MGSAASMDVHRNAALLEDLDALVAKQNRFVRHALAQRGQPSVDGRSVTTTSAPAAGALPPGSRVYVWKQDPSVARIGVRKVFLPHRVLPGPKDEHIEVVLQLTTKKGAVEKDQKATELALSDAEAGDFLVDFATDPFTFDLVHCYTVARLVLDMFLRDLKLPDWRWQWDKDTPPNVARTPLRIVAHAGEKANATYHRGKRALKFYYLTVGGTTAYLCRSFDIVAHETGHAILDALKPKLYAQKAGQSGALHEAFADLTAVFAVLDQLDMCEDVVAETKGNLRAAGYLTAIGEQFAAHMRKVEGAGTGMDEDDANDEEHQEVAGMRNMNNTMTGETCGTDIYSLANVFSGFVFDVLVKLFESKRNPMLGASDAETLHLAARRLRRVLLLALFNAPDVPNFSDLAVGMEKAAEVDAASAAEATALREMIAAAKNARKLAVAGEAKRRPVVDLGEF